MKIFSVTDPEFKPYGRVVTGLDTAKAEILAALANTPLPAATDYVTEDAALQELPAAVEVSEHLFGGMPCQLGWCNGHNIREPYAVYFQGGLTWHHAKLGILMSLQKLIRFVCRLCSHISPAQKSSAGFLPREGGYILPRSGHHNTLLF